MNLKTNRELIKRRLRELNLTYKAAAECAQISVYTLNRIAFDPKYGTPRSFARKRLADVLGVSEEEIFPVVRATGKAS